MPDMNDEHERPHHGADTKKVPMTGTSIASANTMVLTSSMSITTTKL